MKKLLLSLVLILVLCISMIPPIIFANQNQVDEDGNQLITDVIELYMKEPKLNEQVFFEIKGKEDAPYRVSIEKWKYRSYPGGGKEHQTFKKVSQALFEEAMYDCIIKVTPNDGYAFPETLSAKPILHVDDQTYEVDYTKPLHLQNLPNVEISHRFKIGNAIAPLKVNELSLAYEPLEIGKPGNFVAPVSEDANYNMEVKILDEIKATILTENDVITKGNCYRVLVACVAKPGYEFPYEGVANIQAYDTNGEPFGAYSHDRDKIILNRVYDFRDPEFESIHLRFSRPNVGDLIRDTQQPVPVFDEENNQYEIKSMEIKQSDPNDTVYKQDCGYTCVLNIHPKEGYRLINYDNKKNISVVDQYGEQYHCGKIWKFRMHNRIPMDYLQLEIHYSVPETRKVTFKVEHGTWKDGTKDDIVVEVPIYNHISVLPENQVPTGMIPDEFFEGGQWNETPNTSALEYMKDVEYIYQFKKKENVATIQLHIVNGRWMTNDRLHSDDIFIYVPLIDGKGKLDSELLPKHFVRDHGCEFGEWDERFDFSPGAITEDKVYIYECPRVIYQPVTYSIIYDTNDGSKPIIDSHEGDDIYFSYYIPEKLTPKREGYTFTGWNSKQDGSGKDYVIEEYFMMEYKEPTLQLYAQWKQQPHCAISFTHSDSTIALPKDMLIYANAQKQYQVKIPNDIIPTKDGHDFIGYQLINHSDKTYYQPNDIITLTKAGQYQLTPVFEERKETMITLSYDANGGTNVPEQQGSIFKSEDVTFTISSTIPVKDGYSFIGWKAMVNGKEILVQPNDYINLRENTCLYAQWEPIKQDDVIVNPKPDEPNPSIKPEEPSKPNKQENIVIPSIKDEVKKIEDMVDEHLEAYIIPGVAIVAVVLVLLLLMKKHHK